MGIYQRRLATGARAIFLAFFCVLLLYSTVHADVAPPESPPGVIISPGSESTQVRMVSEVVVLTIISSGNQVGKAKTTATFLMRNMGSTEETIAVRFPLTFGEALYYDNLYPEISDFKVEIGGRLVQTTRITSLDENSGKQIPWASFSVNFPVAEDVTIKVIYTTDGFGYPPFLTYRYILETGAGWKDSIGSGDIIIQMPYPASSQNVLNYETSGFSQVAGAPVYSGNEVRWHFENLEPTNFENFQIDLIAIPAWKKVLTERENSSLNPKDGEAWGRLGKAIKEVLRYPKGYLRDDEAGKQLYQEAVLAYEQAVTLLPNDALWHYGYADLLWSHYFFSEYFSGTQDYSELTRLVDEIRISLKINPNNQDVKDLADWISGSLPWAVSESGQGYDFIVLTATPTQIPSTATQAPEVTPEPIATEIASLPTMEVDATEPPQIVKPSHTPVIVEATDVPVEVNIPVCGSVFLIPLLLGWLFFRRR